MRIQFTLLSAALMTVLAAVSNAEDDAKAAVFSARASDGTVLVTAPQAYQQAEVRLITVAGNIERTQFAAGEVIRFAVPDADGVYPFQVVLSPRQKLAVAEDNIHGRLAGDGANPATVDQQSFFYEGRIVVTQGRARIVDANTFAAAEATPVEAQVGDSDDVRVEEPPLATQVFAEDLVVQGSVCAGTDCGVAESFGADTLRFRENNLRIHFDDTSAAGGGFANNDWRITVNDQASGGAGHFSIDDVTSSLVPFRINAGARANSIYVDVNAGSGPRVGIGTGTPGTQLHVFGTDTPTVRMEQVGGFGNYTWDVAGNETNFFIRAVTNGSALPFRIRPQAVTNTLMLGNNGRVGVNLVGGSGANPQAILHVGSNTATTADTLFRVDNSSAATVLALNDEGDMTLAGTLSQLSSEKAKEHFADIDTQELLGALRQMQIYTWNYKHQHPGERHLGPTAEGFYAAFGLGKDPRHIAVSDLAGVALAASQVLAERLVEKEQQMELLEQRMQAMELMMQRVLEQQPVAGIPGADAVARQ